ncbi:hypothetical protein BDN70DRAFT_908782 [Pholiota conissans]|uniref:Uncharacterized protein n=1 Tax=Pholiota conissans TaxID=109636 RepID=A0A9P5YSA3_9AGAR|nr:hypothetical protein BDN70DRAFT_908782 [Pholiota conissans]
MHCIQTENIPSVLILNSNQMQVCFAQGCNSTYAPIGSKHVTIVGSEEKWAITVLVSLTNNGVVLPFQAIHKGTTPASLPSKSCQSYQECIDAGFLFESSITSTYWSMQKTMQNFVNTTLALYFDDQKKKLNLPSDHIHQSEEFLNWMQKEHKNTLVNFVSARMTGLFRPCDVGFQCIFKHSL